MDGLLLVAAGLLFLCADSGIAQMAGLLLASAGVVRAGDASSYYGIVGVVVIGAVVLLKALHSFPRRGPGMWTVLARKVEEDRRRGRRPGLPGVAGDRH